MPDTPIHAAIIHTQSSRHSPLISKGNSLHLQTEYFKLNTKTHITIIGGGPAGLRAAEVAASHGATVTLYDAMRSVGRKFLVAGKSGLNLTHNESIAPFLEHYSGTDLPEILWRDIITRFDNHALRNWAADLGIETSVASSGKIFPSPMKAAPLLRRWIERLRSLGVIFKMNHTWTGFTDKQQATFSHAGETITARPGATILALGGASWPQTGSTGNWTSILEEKNIRLTPLSPANCGWETHWPTELLENAEGLPIKNLRLKAESPHQRESLDISRRGELVITRYGLEGGPIYRLGPAIRAMASPHIIIDFKPDLTLEAITTRLSPVKRNFIREARRRLKLDPATCAILKYMPNRGPWKSGAQLAYEIKNCHIPLTRPRPIDEAISSAGGISWKELDEHLMIKKLPGLFVAGEMIDWEAPTGGYLLQACFATGDYAAHSALNFLLPHS